MFYYSQISAKLCSSEVDSVTQSWVGLTGTFPPLEHEDIIISEAQRSQTLSLYCTMWWKCHLPGCAVIIRRGTGGSSEARVLGLSLELGPLRRKLLIIVWKSEAATENSHFMEITIHLNIIIFFTYGRKNSYFQHPLLYTPLSLASRSLSAAWVSICHFPFPLWAPMGMMWSLTMILQSLGFPGHRFCGHWESGTS